MLEKLDSVTYLGRCFSSNGNSTSENTAKASEAQAAYANMRHLWRCTYVSLVIQV